jgi:hypothetical protein
MPCSTKSKPTQNSKSKCATPCASSIPSGSNRTATALPFISTRNDSPNCLPYLPKSRPLIVPLLLIMSDSSRPQAIYADEFFHTRRNARCLPASPSWQSGLFLCWNSTRILFTSPAMLAFSQQRSGVPAFKSDAVPPCSAAPSINLDLGHSLSRSAHSFFRGIRIFLSDSIDSSPFQEVSLGREASTIFSYNAPLIYRWKRKQAGL